MTHHLIPNPRSATHLTLLRSPSPETEAVPIVLDLDRRIQFAQRLAALIRRIQTQPRVQTKKEQADES
ncbi:MAG TPA: hypothetical protein VLQ80_25040 [Candidatus Saccharimonadia bacterium]|nr:hypothetical protein [Candidatus Saccharimonadia bacterium]